MNITVEYSVIKSLLLTAAKDDIRYYLNGVCIDIRDNGDAVLVSTNGHIMLAVPVPVEDIQDLMVGQWIIDRVNLESVKPMKAGRTEFPITIEIIQPDTYTDAEGRSIRPVPQITITGITKATTTQVDGKFPDWRRVMPNVSMTAPEASQFSPDYIEAFGKIAKLMTGRKDAIPFIHHRGSTPALVSGLGRNALGVLMPMRADPTTDGQLPAWAVNLPASESAAA